MPTERRLAQENSNCTGWSADALRDKARNASERVSIGKASGGLAKASAHQLDLVVFDDGIGQQGLAHLLDGRLGGGLVGLRQLDLDELALADILDAAEAQAGQGVLHRLALGIEDAVLQGNMNSGFHWTVSGPLKSRGPPSSRMPRRRATS